MNNNLTTIAALPQGSGCLSKLPAEVGRAPALTFPAINPDFVPRAPYFDYIEEIGNDE